MSQRYPTDLTDTQWTILTPFIPAAKPGGRPRTTDMREVVQWRWIVERTFGWLNRSRRLSKDFEALPETTESWIRIAMIQLMVKRLAARA